MKHRKLRIAFSVTCGIVCVLLVVLWVRSCWRADFCHGTLFQWRAFRIGSHFGGVELAFVPLGSMNPDLPRIYSSEYDINDHDSLTKDLTWGFRWSNIESFTIVRAPDWLFVVMCSLAAALPWLPWRFSLRTLLIATTLVAVVLGLIVYAAR